MVDFDYSPSSNTSGDDYKPSGDGAIPYREPERAIPLSSDSENTQLTSDADISIEDVSNDGLENTGEESGPLLSFEEGRVLGCLIEKAKTTPDSYPLSLNALTNACNQKTSRLPVTDLDEGDIIDAIEGLRLKRLVHRVDQAGARTPKFQHRAIETIDIENDEAALLCVLLLRGPQTPGEIRSRTERLYAFDSTAEVEQILRDLAGRHRPLVKVIPPSQGRKEHRYHQLYSEYPLDIPDGSNEGVPFYKATGRVSAECIESLEARVEELERQLAQLNGDFKQLRELLD
ncbi:MAG: YceH family protein [Opitutae bacterium]|nr:YceH family protein [Opitutae bacterium]